jgi:xanthine dehydrogenase YagS FAD-binding subunit
MRPFDYIQPPSIDEAISLLDREPDQSRLLAGGTDLLTLMKLEIATPDHLIDVKRLPELDDTIERSDEGIAIGALATLSRLETDQLIRPFAPALAEAAAVAATPQLRNMATIGGNLLQRSRCWYYRSEQVTCWLQGGTECQAREGENQYHALFGDSPCVSIHPSDLATALVMLGAEVTLKGPDGTRQLPLAEFFVLPTEERRTENLLQPNEIITSIRIPNDPANERSTYLKAMDRKVWAFALVGVGARLLVEDGRIAAARLVLGGVAPIPWPVPEAERLLVGEPPSADLFDRVAQVAVEGAQPLAKNGYKIPLVTALVRRAFDGLSQ